MEAESSEGLGVIITRMMSGIRGGRELA